MFKSESSETTLSDFASAVRHGLLKDTQKTLPCQFIYDAFGSRLFEEICSLQEYYPARCETSILRERSDEIAKLCTDKVTIVEMGAGSASKTRCIFDSLRKTCSDIRYFPIDVSSDALRITAKSLRREYPDLIVTPFVAEYEVGFQNIPSQAGRSVVVLWLGTSIGNVEPEEAGRILRNVRKVCTVNGLFILGVDLKKDRDALEQAYNDVEGVTARFNLNLLARINRELGGQFDLTAFEHRAFYNEQAARIEMHLVSRRKQTVSIDHINLSVDFEGGETIHTENSYKFSESEIANLASHSGFRLEHHWRDDRGLFSVNVLRAR